MTETGVDITGSLGGTTTCDEVFSRVDSAGGCCQKNANTGSHVNVCRLQSHVAIHKLHENAFQKSCFTMSSKQRHLRVKGTSRNSFLFVFFAFFKILPYMMLLSVVGAPCCYSVSKVAVTSQG